MTKTKKKTSAPAKRTGSNASGKGSGTFRKLANTAVLALSLFGAHNLAERFVPGYAPWVQSTVQTAEEKIPAAAKTAIDKVTPEPTITITGEADFEKSPYDNLTVGVPSTECDVIIDRLGYALGYDEKTEQPRWVSYRLTADEVNSDKAKRTDNFRSDDAIPTGSATPADYKGSNYDRGHLAPAADMSFSVQAMNESFYMSNMSPQDPSLNRGAWRDLEAWTRNAANQIGEVYVVSGPVFFDDQKVISIGKNEVAVPHAYYKVVLDMKSPKKKAIGFILPNDNCRQPLSSYAVTVDHVELVTGLDFFGKVHPALESKIESNCNFSAWPTVKEK